MWQRSHGHGLASGHPTALGDLRCMVRRKDSACVLGDLSGERLKQLQLQRGVLSITGKTQKASPNPGGLATPSLVNPQYIRVLLAFYALSSCYFKVISHDIKGLPSNMKLLALL